MVETIPRVGVFRGNHHSRVSEVVRNGLRPSTVWKVMWAEK